MDAVYSPILFLIPVLPLLGAVVLTLFGAKMGRGAVTVVALLAVFGAFVVTVLAGINHVQVGVPLEQTLWKWIAVGRYRFDLALGLDALSLVLMLVVTGVGFLIHLYSTEYMHDDPSYWRYFAYLNFFIFAMSVLVLGSSLPVLFIGWEGVGLASYLLIGFWFSDEAKAAAGKKAFITNRVGDFGFLLGMFTLIALFGTADFAELREAVVAVKDAGEVLSIGIFQGYTIRGVMTFAALCFFLGACGKSAQIPLHVWLPDAMAGPTPVSALIHAATMVTAGVYMISRMFFVFDMTPVALDVIAWVGASTALFAATIGLAQNDIKKVLAYSTVSQLGYMFLAVGLGAYSAAMFHLVTHAFFKACLFLGSGAVIHSLHGEQDMRKMGGLKDKIPVVYWTFLISTLALAGVAPLSGFVSKDGILAFAFQEKPILWIMGFAGAGLTALYMARVMGMTFFGSLRLQGEDGRPAHVHAPGWAIKIPLVVLAGLAVVAGVLNVPHVIGHPWLEGFLNTTTSIKSMTLSHGTEIVLMLASTGWAIACFVVGFQVYKKGPSKKVANLTRAGVGKTAHILLQGKWFIDEIYQALIVRPLRGLASLCSVFVDAWIIDGLGVKGSSYAVLGVGKVLSKLQSGNVQSYASFLLLAVVVIVLWAVR